jgi:hypothetical protein
LKLNENPHEIAAPDDLKSAILRLRFPAEALKAVKIAKDSGKLPSGQEACLTFELSVRAERLDGQAADPMTGGKRPRLMRVRWEGKTISDDSYDAREKIVANLEFDASVAGVWEMISSGDFAALVPEHTSAGGSSRVAVDTTKAQQVVLNPSDSSIITLKFAPGSIARGWCYQLELAAGLLDADMEIMTNKTDMCTTNCLCDAVGTDRCIESSGTCQCKFPHTGKYCDKCATGHTKDPDTGRCFPIGRCTGGSPKKRASHIEDCSNHGTCSQRGEAAVCQCDRGFVNDGRIQCGKCEDPMFNFPDCKKRGMIIFEPDVRCEGLPHRLPAGLYKEAENHHVGDPLQGDDGVLKWAGRYRLSEGGTEITSSDSYFKVPTASVVRFFVDTIRTGTLVRYRILDAGSEEVVSSSATLAADDGFAEAG